MNVTIREVAKAAGVSTATVSNVLNKTGKVGPGTHRLVLSAVKRLGYVPDVHARRLASQNRRTLGIIVSDIENPFFPEVVNSFEMRARQLGYDVIFSDTNYDPRRTREAAERMMEHKVRGVAIMTSEIGARLVQELARRKIAVTFLDLAPIRGYMSNLRIDYASGVEQIVQYLYRNGHRSISFVAGRPGLQSNTLRLEAYEKSMRNLGLEPGPVLPGDLRFEGGLDAGMAIAHLSSKPTAIMAVNDLTAVGVIKGLLRSGLRVPEDVSVTGFDNTRLAEYVNPSLTTVDVHRETLGHMAADALHELSCTPDPQGKEYHIGAELVVGDSSGPAPAVVATDSTAVHTTNACPAPPGINKFCEPRKT
ncbi:MAG: LacI family DNA-binding transcriptional regulator [Acidobacteria bacterium]|nr:LacI family DNA-binding transcriptional regulator [Acidobacteriota bacterium]